MARKQKSQAVSGKFVAVNRGMDSAGNVAWDVVSVNTGKVHRSVVTSESSAASISKIAKKHSKALGRLAKK